MANIPCPWTQKSPSANNANIANNANNATGDRTNGFYQLKPVQC